MIYTDQKTTAQQIVRSQENKPIRVKTTTHTTTTTTSVPLCKMFGAGLVSWLMG